MKNIEMERWSSLSEALACAVHLNVQLEELVRLPAKDQGKCVMPIASVK